MKDAFSFVLGVAFALLIQLIGQLFVYLNMEKNKK